jgi:hypothetical protein
MATYYMNEGAFDLPDLGFADKTVHLFSAPHPDGGEIGLIIGRSPMPKGKTLEQMVDAHIESEAKAMRAFAVLEKRTVEVDGVTGIDVSSRYRNRGEMAYQRQIYFVAYGVWMLIGANASLARRGAADECLGQVIGSFRHRP